VEEKKRKSALKIVGYVNVSPPEIERMCAGVKECTCERERERERKKERRVSQCVRKREWTREAEKEREREYEKGEGD
jgi:hypothetical protein